MPMAPTATAEHTTKKRKFSWQVPDVPRKSCSIHCSRNILSQNRFFTRHILRIPLTSIIMILSDKPQTYLEKSRHQWIYQIQILCTCLGCTSRYLFSTGEVSQVPRLWTCHHIGQNILPRPHTHWLGNFLLLGGLASNLPQSSNGASISWATTNSNIYIYIYINMYVCMCVYISIFLHIL